MCQCPATHGGAEEESCSPACLDSKDPAGMDRAARAETARARNDTEETTRTPSRDPAAAGDCSLGGSAWSRPVQPNRADAWFGGGCRWSRINCCTAEGLGGDGRPLALDLGGGLRGMRATRKEEAEARGRERGGGGCAGRAHFLASTNPVVEARVLARIVSPPAMREDRPGESRPDSRASVSVRWI